MAKIKSGTIKTLAEVMAQNTDLAPQANWNRAVVGDPTASSLGSDAPVLDEPITALLIMAGAEARWAFNYWLITNRAGKRSGVSAAGDFEEWRTVLNDMAGGGLAA